ncbi:MAG: cytochrome c [Acidobacteria bacterium]|nr:cytochrome c [Acidobacteriota bacterium]
MNTKITRAGRALAGLAVIALTAARCRQDMHDAPRYDPLEASDFFRDGSTARPLIAGTVARGHLNADTYLHTGKDAIGLPVNAFPFAISRADLDRGEERFNVFCTPCHGTTGEGNGMIVQRGYRQAQSMHIDRLRFAPVGYFYDVVTNGFGVMPDYRSQIPVDDRWRIVAYVRALQASRQATEADVPADVMQQLRQGAATVPVAPGGGETNR